MHRGQRRTALIVVLTALLGAPSLRATAVGTAGSEAGAPATRDLAGSWTWPLEPQPVVVHPFVAPLDPYGPGHRGVDLAGAVGQPVLAVAAGTVSFAGSVAGRGVVVVDHGRLRTTYEPVLVEVRTGERIRRGDVVGTLTLASGHCLPATCLHLGARDGDRYVDPLLWLGSGVVRLLPLGGSPQARGWASLYAVRSRSALTWV